jgi:excinuclease ABC subunit A
VIIVEHDRDVILASDYIIDMGPGAGKNGGLVLATGTPEEIMKNPDSVTGPYLSNEFNGFKPGVSLLDGLPVNHRRRLNPGLTIRNAFANNLKGFDLEIPSAGIIAVTGVSGSGKSTLLFEVILASGENKKATGCSSIEGFENFQRIVCVHQRTGFTSPLATPATFTGIFDRIRDLFALVPDSKVAGLVKNSFSYLNKEGRCPVCEGTGKIRISMDFLSDVTMECEECTGKRYRKEILSCLYKGQNISDILEMSVSEAGLFFNDQKNLSEQLQILEKVGMGYLKLGQSLDSLSGGESQRLTLAAELMKPAKGPTLYLFEEPSTGLHFRDVECLLALFQQLADQGNTLLIIEHDPMIIARADYIIELGPVGGDRGGFLIRQ